MLRFIAFLCMALLTCIAPAQSQFLRGDELQAEVKKLCDEGCIVFSPAEIEALKQAVEAEIQRQRQIAYEVGKLTCRNAISFKEPV